MTNTARPYRETPSTERGTEDRAPKGRNEMGVWWRRHDEYDKR